MISYFCFFFTCIDGAGGPLFFSKTLVLLSNSPSLSSPLSLSHPPLAEATESSAFLAAFLFPASNLACNFFSTGSFDGPNLDWRATFAPSPSLQNHRKQLTTKQQNKDHGGQCKDGNIHLEGRPSDSTCVGQSFTPLLMLLTHCSACTSPMSSTLKKKAPLLACPISHPKKHGFCNWVGLNSKIRDGDLFIPVPNCHTYKIQPKSLQPVWF